MVKTILKSIFKISVLVTFAICFALFASKVVRPSVHEETDNTKNKVDGFYALTENSMDILVLGTSHAYTGINPSVLYHYTGLNSYDFAGQCQPMEVTYNYLVEALKTQKPELVIVDIFALSDEATKCQVPGAYRTSIQDLKASENKWNAYKNMYDHSVVENFFDLSLYSNRLSEIDYSNIEGILENKSDYFFGHTIVYPYSKIVWEREVPETTGAQLPPERRYQSILNIIELCKENDIDLMFIKTPYYLNQDDVNVFQSIWELCNQEGIPYIDFNRIQKDINYVYESDGDSWHANASGAFKLTKYLSQFISDNFEITNDSNIYEENYKALYFETLQVIYKTNKSYHRLNEFINNMDVTTLIYDKYNRYSSTNEKVVYQPTGYYYDRYIAYNGNSVEMRDDGSVLFNGDLYYVANDDFLYVVVDNVTGQIVDIINVEKMEDFE